MNELKRRLENNYTLKNEIYMNSDDRKGYWSNLSKDDQDKLFSQLEEKTTKDAVNELFPHLNTIIFDPVRAVGLKLLQIKEDEVGVDYGCMWGNLLLYCTKNCHSMLGIDQTYDSLQFVKKRLKEEKLTNCKLLNTNLRNDLPFDGLFDFAVVNGVLEWIPEEGPVDLGDYLKRKVFKIAKPSKNPKEVQLDFLKKVHKNLTDDGRMYLAIENRYDYQYFLWKKDPHPDIFWTAFLPRKLSNFIMNIWYGRPYVNYLHSDQKLEELILSAGFKDVSKYAVFPDYRFPRKIIDFKNKTNDYNSIYNSLPTSSIPKKIFRRVRRLLDTIIYKKLRLFSLSPSFIIIAKK